MNPKPLKSPTARPEGVAVTQRDVLLQTHEVRTAVESPKRFGHLLPNSPTWAQPALGSSLTQNATS